jgi:hypothetical protein
MEVPPGQFRRSRGPATPPEGHRFGVDLTSEDASAEERNTSTPILLYTPVLLSVPILLNTHILLFLHGVLILLRLLSIRVLRIILCPHTHGSESDPCARHPHGGAEGQGAHEGGAGRNPLSHTPREESCKAGGAAVVPSELSSRTDGGCRNSGYQ